MSEDVIATDAGPKVLKTLEDYQNLLQDVRRRANENIARQREIKRRQAALLVEAKELSDEDFPKNRARVEEIRGIRARRNEPLFDDDGSPVLDDNGEQKQARRYFKDDTGLYVMRQPGIVTELIREISGYNGKEGLYQEYRALKGMEAALSAEVNKRQSKAVTHRMKGLELLQGRFRDLGLEIPPSEDEEDSDEE